jgi:hypothetical protein
MYPFRVMSMGEQTLVAVSKFCKPVAEMSLLRLARFAERKSAEFLKLAECFPEIVKEYNDEYVILKVVNFNGKR